ncbi:MAG: hypothetical protein HY286_09220 [Planctomycetes bacterium]|nr:hypothetical protein [Planctomycetota bacterium]
MEHTNEAPRATKKNESRNTVPTVSANPERDCQLEMVYDQKREATAFVLFRAGVCETVPDFQLPDGRKLVPFSPRNNLIEHGVVRFAAGPKEYGSEPELAKAIQQFIHRYVDLSPQFERIATSYVLLTWLFDAFNELPYLRIRGEPGTGKTRFLLTVGSICYKPIFASGASTVSPIFRILDAMRGTLIIDESDFRVSDERAEVVKILNNGNVRGFPVLRSETVNGGKEFNPRAYHVFGPKLLATRGFFDDAALESRFLTEKTEAGRLRNDIPINLPPEHDVEALELRNQLLLFRFRNMGRVPQLVEFADRSLEPRLAQVFAPLLAVAADEETRTELRTLARQYNADMAADRGSATEADLLEAVRDLCVSAAGRPSMKEIAALLMERHGREYDNISAKRVGWLLRRKLGLATEKSHGSFVLAGSESEKLARLYARYGIEQQTTGPLPEQSPPSPQRLPDAA